jgi:hypothetical protein
VRTFSYTEASQSRPMDGGGWRSSRYACLICVNQAKRMSLGHDNGAVAATDISVKRSGRKNGDALTGEVQSTDVWKRATFSRGTSAVTVELAVETGDAWSQNPFCCYCSVIAVDSWHHDFFINQEWCGYDTVAVCVCFPAVSGNLVWETPLSIPDGKVISSYLKKQRKVDIYMRHFAVNTGDIEGGQVICISPKFKCWNSKLYMTRTPSGAMQNTTDCLTEFKICAKFNNSCRLLWEQEMGMAGALNSADITRFHYNGRGMHSRREPAWFNNKTYPPPCTISKSQWLLHALMEICISVAI